MPDPKDPLHLAISRHPRVFETNRYVYPVISRRSQGLSVGINLNPDKICNFNCIYCQVDRSTPPLYREVDLPTLERELCALLEDAVSGALFNHPRFQKVPEKLRRINDIAFSGDGEPTASPVFPESVRIASSVKKGLGLNEVKLIAITNATRFHRPDVLAALEEMHRNNGEVWAKLDAGTAEYFARIERTRIPFQTILQNLDTAARRWPIIIQTLFMRIRGEGPEPEEIAAYTGVLKGIQAKGGTLKGIQIYTVARQPAEPFVEPLPDSEMEIIVQAVRDNLPGVPVEAYFGP